MSSRLRRARVEEIPALGDLCLRSKAHWGYDAAFLEACCAELHPGAEAIASGRVWVVEQDGVVAGVAEVSVDGAVAHLEKLFVEPKLIGSGVGRRLFDWARAEAALLGAEEMLIDSDPGAVPFYLGSGARETGLVPSGSIPGRMLPRLVLSLQRSRSHQAIAFRVDDLSGEAVRELILRHLEAMNAYSPPESVHALDLGALRKPEITFWTGWIGGELACMGALKRLDAARGEIKSMRATDKWMGRGVGRAMLDHIIAEARRMKLKSLWLETGTPDPFWPARRLYERAGFRYCEPFGDYVPDRMSVFMAREI